MSITDKFLRVTMPDSSRWDVPVWVISDDRANSYVDEFNGSHERSLSEDTIPLFEEDEYEIVDWAANNMNWEDVEEWAVCAKDAVVDLDEGWANGSKKIVEKESQ